MMTFAKEFEGELWVKASDYQQKLTEAIEEANRRSNTSWTKMCTQMVEQEREACAKICDELETCSDAEFYGHEFSAAIRGRGLK